MTKLGEKLQRCPEYHGQSEKHVAEIPELLVEQAWPKPVGMEEAIVDCPVQVIRTKRRNDRKPDIEQKISTAVHCVAPEKLRV